MSYSFEHPAQNFMVYCFCRIWSLAPDPASQISDHTARHILSPYLADGEEIEVLPFCHDLELHGLDRWDVDPVFRDNVESMAKFLGLYPFEKDMLAYAILYATTSYFSSMMDSVLDDLILRQKVRLFSLLFDGTLDEAERVLTNRTKLFRSGLVEFEEYGLEMRYSAAQEFFSTYFDPRRVLEGSFTRAKDPRLSPEDYDYFQEYELIRNFLEVALTRSLPGAHLLIYGPPGCGKTELVRLMAREIEAELYEPTYDRGDFRERDRFRSYLSANYLLRGHRAFILFDDADTFLNEFVDKAWFNSILEEAAVPTVWICNDLDIHPAVARRFKMIVKMDYLPRNARERMLRYYLGGILDQSEKAEEWFSRASRSVIPPAVVANAAEVLLHIGPHLEMESERALTMIINQTLEAMGMKKMM